MAACSSGGRNPLDRQSSNHRLEAVQLLARKRATRFVGHGEVREQSLQGQLGMSGDGLGQGDGSLRAGPYTVHAGVDLYVNCDRSRTISAPGVDGLYQGAKTAFGVDGRSELVVHHQLHSLTRRLGKDQDRDVYAGFPHLVPLLCQGHPQMGGASGHRRGCHRDGTMTVTVRLDDRAHGGGGHHSSDLGYVRRYGGQVHLHPGRAQPARDADRVPIAAKRLLTGVPVAATRSVAARVIAVPR